jgi:hypothetical protein
VSGSLDIADRDGWACVCCGTRLDTAGRQASAHHRIHGRRSDNRWSAKILLWGSGITECHGRWGGTGRAEAYRLGYVISRHDDPVSTLLVPVFYNQRNLGRVGWMLLDDTGRVIPAGYDDPSLDARELAEVLATERSR